MILKNDMEIEAYVRWVFVNPGLPWPGGEILQYVIHEIEAKRDLLVVQRTDLESRLGDLSAEIGELDVTLLQVKAFNDEATAIGRPVKDVPAV